MKTKSVTRKFIASICSICFILLYLCGCSLNETKNNDKNNVLPKNSDSTTNDYHVSSNDQETQESTLSKEEIMRTAVLQYPSQNDEWKYNVYDCYVEITEYIGEKVEVLTIPNEIESLPVYKYSPEFKPAPISEITIKDTVKSVVFPKNLLVIGDFAFSGFENIESIVLPNYLIEIGRCAFNNCPSLKKVSIPETLETIGDSAFQSCSSLKEIILPLSVEKIGDGAFRDTNNDTGIALTVYNPKLIFNKSQYCSVIKGYAGSTAAQYAAKHNIKFEIIK